MKVADLRKQSSAPSVSTSDVIGLYADSNGVLTTVDSAGAKYAVGFGQVTGTFNPSLIATGGSATVQTGLLFGGAGALQTGLGSPSLWISVFHNGVGYGVPAYRLK